MSAKGALATPAECASLDIADADELLIVTTIAVDYNEAEPSDWCARHLDAVPMEFDELRNDHVAEHSSFFDRMSLMSDRDTDAEGLPTECSNQASARW